MLTFRKNQPEMDLDTLFGKARKLANKSANKKQHDTFLSELDEFEQFMEDNAYDVDALKNESSQIRDGYLSSHRNSKQALNVFNKITSIINPQSNRNHHHHHHHHHSHHHHNQNVGQFQQSSLIRKKLHNKLDHFTNLIDFSKNRSPFVTRDQSYITVDKYIGNEYRFLKPLEKVSVKNGIPLSEYLVTGYHQSGLPINQYIAQNELFNQLKINYDLSPINRHINIAHQHMTNYLIEYEKVVCKPIHNLKSLPLQQHHKYNDDITIIMNYIIEINLGINKVLSKQTSYPVQLDVFFVAPQMYTHLNLHSLPGVDKIKSDRASRKNGAVDAIADIYHLLRRAANSINKANGQRFIMLIVRDKKFDTSCDTVYIYKSSDTEIGPGFVSDNVELSYLLNSKCGTIMNGVHGLSPTGEGILGLSHHLHSPDCNKVYLSYANYKSRVFKQDILSLLPIVFEPQISGRHIIVDSKRTDFINSYREFKDFGYAQVGQYWFNNKMAYECFEPYWNPSNCRAMGNVFIAKNSPSCTEDLNKYIDESFESAEKLYYKMDYTVGMEIIDKQTIYIKKNDKSICLINTELHRNGQLLYAVIVENTFKSKQKWKIIDYTHISQAFMTASQLVEKYGIFIIDLPKGSKAKHNNFVELKNKINVTKALIRTTNWSHIRIVQSKQNLGKLGLSSSSSSSSSYPSNKSNKSNCNGNGIGVLAISERRFKQLALKSLLEYREKGMALTPIAHFKFRKNKYHLEKLLPVYIPEHGKYVAISFWYNQVAMAGTERGRTQASGVCLDLTDMKNKANLVQQVPTDSWLNINMTVNNDMTVNNLTIGQHDTPATFGRNHQNQKKKKKASKKMKKKIRFIAPKVSPMAPCTPVMRAQPQPQPQPNYTHTLQQLMQNNNIRASAPQLIASSSVGSVASSIPSLPMQSMPCMMQQSSHPSYANMQQCSVPNIQQLQQNAQYFANFLPSNFNPVNTINTVTTSPNAVNCFYNNNNNANYSTHYNMQYNQQYHHQYTMRYN